MLAGHPKLSTNLHILIIHTRHINDRFSNDIQQYDIQNYTNNSIEFVLQIIYSINFINMDEIFTLVYYYADVYLGTRCVMKQSRASCFSMHCVMMMIPRRDWWQINTNWWVIELVEYLPLCGYRTNLIPICIHGFPVIHIDICYCLTRTGLSSFYCWRWRCACLLFVVHCMWLCVVVVDQMIM